MPMTLGPPLWATGSWAANAWANGTWATTVSSGYGIDDLTTMVSFHLETLLPGDQTVDLRTYANAVRGTTGENDLNTAMWVDLR